MLSDSLVFSLTSAITKIIFSHVSCVDIGASLTQWTRECQQNSNLIGTKQWDRKWKHMLSFKLLFIQKYADQFFLAKADYERKGDTIANTSN